MIVIQSDIFTLTLENAKIKRSLVYRSQSRCLSDATHTHCTGLSLKLPITLKLAVLMWELVVLQYVLHATAVFLYTIYFFPAYCH